MTNVEIKAVYPDLARGRAVSERLGARFVGVDLQRDTYYHARSGRLKLRTSSIGPNVLIGYHRPDRMAAKESDYTLLEVTDPDALHRILDATLGVWLDVRKARTIYLIDNVRVHLDEVDGLGCFLEFEAVVLPGRTVEEGRTQVDTLMKEYGIRPGDLLDVSYSDLLARRLKPPPRDGACSPNQSAAVRHGCDPTA